MRVTDCHIFAVRQRNTCERYTRAQNPHDLLVRQYVPEITALHAITTGALGSLAIGMMTRVPLGHTERALAADKAMLVAFVLVNVGALLRISAPTLFPMAGLLCGTAFAIYFVRFLPIHFGDLRARNG